MFIHVYTVHGCFCTMIADMSSYNLWDHMAHKAEIFTIWTFIKKKLPAPGMNHIFSSIYLFNLFLE